jgi:hypothetical protein
LTHLADCCPAQPHCQALATSMRTRRDALPRWRSLRDQKARTGRPALEAAIRPPPLSGTISRKPPAASPLQRRARSTRCDLPPVTPSCPAGTIRRPTTR